MVKRRKSSKRKTYGRPYHNKATYPCEKLVRSVMRKKGWSKERAQRYVFGGMRRHGWRPRFQK